LGGDFTRDLQALKWGGVGDPNQDMLEVVGTNVRLNLKRPADSLERVALREGHLQQFKACQVRGHASEGMLCNTPPIPLRVADFLDAADLLNLALVCKATHEASHLLFDREVRFTAFM
jgi:hypothetical protein